MKLDQKVALITGAGSGIGRAIAGSLARRGCHLALADINTDGLQETAELNKMNGVTISTHKLDVTDRDAVKALPPAILEAHGRIDLLINNAGVAAAGTFDRISEAHFDRVMAVNFDGVVSMTRTFLPYLQEQEEAVIANVSSLFGIISPPEQTAYSASKFAVRGFSNALRHELEATNVLVTVIHPGGISTNIVRNAMSPTDMTEEQVQRKKARQQKMLVLPPEQAGEIIIKGIEQNRERILVGQDAKVLSLLERIMPVDYWQVMKYLAARRRKKRKKR